jgi:copper transport protein
MGFEDTLRNIAGTLLRFSAFSAHALLFGLIAILILVLRPSFAGLDSEEWATGRRRLAARLEALVRACLVGSALATALILLLQSALISELGTGEVEADSFLSVLETSFGQWLALRFPVLAGLAVLLIGRIRNGALLGAGDDERAPGAVWWIVWAALSGLLLATSTFSGHSAVAVPRTGAIVNDIIHLASGAVWFTGVIVLAIVLPDGWLGKAKVDRLQLLSPAVTRFSQVAVVAITVVAITGTVNSFLHVGSFSDFWEESYAQTLGLKIGLFFGILALGGINHFVLKRQLEKARDQREPTGAQSTFRKIIAAELVIAVTLMAMTGLLVGLSRTKQGADLPVPETGTAVDDAVSEG